MLGKVIADLFNHRVRQVDAVTGIITTLTGGGSGGLGDGGPATAAKLSYPERLAVDRDDNVYVFNRGPRPVMIFDKGNYTLEMRLLVLVKQQGR